MQRSDEPRDGDAIAGSHGLDILRSGDGNEGIDGEGIGGSVSSESLNDPGI